MASMLVVTGPPGAGKSTVAAVVADRCEPSGLVEGDSFFGFLRRGAIEPWSFEANEQNTAVTRAAGACAGRFALGGMETVYDGVIGPWFLGDFLAATGLDQLDYVVLLPSEEQCVARVAERQNHGFTDEAATRHMHQQFARSDIDPRYLLVDPPERAEAVAERIVAAARDGRLSFAGTTSAS